MLICLIDTVNLKKIEIFLSTFSSNFVVNKLFLPKK